MAQEESADIAEASDHLPKGEAKVRGKAHGNSCETTYGPPTTPKTICAVDPSNRWAECVVIVWELTHPGYLKPARAQSEWYDTAGTCNPIQGASAKAKRRPTLKASAPHTSPGSPKVAAWRKRRKESLQETSLG